MLKRLCILSQTYFKSYNARNTQIPPLSTSSENKNGDGLVSPATDENKNSSKKTPRKKRVSN